MAVWRAFMSEPDHAAHLRFPVAADGRIPRDAETLAAVREVVLGVRDPIPFADPAWRREVSG